MISKYENKSPGNISTVIARRSATTRLVQFSCAIKHGSWGKHGDRFICCVQKILFKKETGLKIGSNVTLQSVALATEEHGYIEIGDYSYLSGAALIATESIILGQYVYIAGGVTIVDSDFHPIDPAARLRDTVLISPAGNKAQRPPFESAPVIIGDNVWIGYNATILKGVEIGEGSIIQPGAVVLRSVPPGSLVSGNPAQVQIKEYA